MKKLILCLLMAGSAYGQTPKQFSDLQAQVAALQKQVAALQPLAALTPFVTVNPNPELGVPGPNITFHGANIHIVNGMGQTQLANGRGNLIIGYDEFQPIALQSYDRSGSHNLIIGRFQDWYQSSVGCLMSGSWNWTNGEGEFVAGYQNVSEGVNSAVLGGQHNVINTGNYSVILGGENNLESGDYATAP